MWYSKYILVLFVSYLFGSFAVGQDQVWFGGSVPYVDVQTEEIVSQDYPSDMAVSSLDYHLEHHNVVTFGESWLLALSRAVQLSITSDIIALLDQAVDKSIIVSDYLSDTRVLLDRVSTQSEYTSVRLNLLADSMQECLTDKDIADRSFFDAINANNDEAAALWLDASLRASVCATEYRVQLNALKVQDDKLKFYVTILQKKYDYIDTQKEYIEKYYTVLRPDLLEELTAIAASLQSFVLVE